MLYYFDKNTCIVTTVSGVSNTLTRCALQTFVVSRIDLFMFSRNRLLTFPSSGLAGLMSLHLGLLVKSGL